MLSTKFRLNWGILHLNWLQTGVYGYAVYAASKFALRGLAESLQQELIERNIRVSIIFPPDTDTPGYAEGAVDTMFCCGHDQVVILLVL